jgi:hypothetical protein
VRIALASAALAIAAPRGARADDPVASDDAGGNTPRALARVIEAGPGPRALTVVLAAGYAYTESVLGLGDRHDRVAGRIGVEARATPWFGLSLLLDGRYDHHTIPGQPSDDGLVGDPRVRARVDRSLGGGLALGARAGLWLPGRNAPSLDASAISPDLIVAASFTARDTPLVLAANLGYRLDRSAHTASDAASISASDRTALGVSAFDAVLLGASAAVGRGRVQGYLEGTWDVLVGHGSPGALASPLLFGAGVRVAATRALRVEAATELSASRRPDISATAPLVPIPPRLAAWFGLTWSFATGDLARADARTAGQRRTGAAEDAAAAAAPAKQARPPAEPAPTPSEDEATRQETARQSSGEIRGNVRSLRGRAVDADIEVRAAGGAEEPLHVLRAEAGRFQIDVAPGSYDVSVTATGYEAQHRRIQVERNGVTLLNVDLRSAR